MDQSQDYKYLLEEARRRYKIGDIYIPIFINDIGSVYYTHTEQHNVISFRPIAVGVCGKLAITAGDFGYLYYEGIWADVFEGRSALSRSEGDHTSCLGMGSKAESKYSFVGFTGGVPRDNYSSVGIDPRYSSNNVAIQSKYAELAMKSRMLDSIDVSSVSNLKELALPENPMHMNFLKELQPIFSIGPEEIVEGVVNRLPKTDIYDSKSNISDILDLPVETIKDRTVKIKKQY